MRKGILRFLALPLAFAPLLAPARDAKPGALVARWPIKTSVPPGTDLKKPGTLAVLADLLALAPAASNRDTAHEDQRYARPAGAKVAEGSILRTRGYLRLVAYEDDGDYHIQLSGTADTFDNCLVVEVPKDDPAFVKDSPDVLAAAGTVRAWVIHNLLKDAAPILGGVYVMQGQAYVEVAGQLFFDSEHQAALAKNVFRGKSIHGKQLPSKTSWELHPVTAIAFAPKPPKPN